jgi:hypothetical protein
MLLLLLLLLPRRFDEECRGQVAENLGKRGVTVHPGHLPTKCVRACVLAGR